MVTRKTAGLLKIAPQKMFFRSALICLTIGLILFGVSLRKIPRLPIDGTPPKFQHLRAYEDMKTLAQRFPYRLPWHQNRKKAGKWIENRFRQAGYEPKEMVFSEVIAGKNYTDLRNIYAEKIGTVHPDEVIVVAAHYDTAEETIEGAGDDASGVGVVLELARIFAKEKTKRTMVFLATDSEEFGAFWGARTFAQSYARKDQIVGVINLDYIGPHDQVGIITSSDGLKEGYAPLWFREMGLDSIRSIGGMEAIDFMNIVEFALRAIQIPAADHGAFLAAGIPSVSWFGKSKNFAIQMGKFHHTPLDTWDTLLPESFIVYGQAAERFMRGIDKLAKIPDNFRDHSYWKISKGYFLDGWVVTLLHLLAFIPFFLFSITKFGALFIQRPKPLIKKVAKNEAKNFGILFGSLLLGYLTIRLLPVLKVVDMYEDFPATQKSQILYHPNYLAILLVIAVIALINWILSRTFRERDDSIDSREIRQGVHAIFMAILIALAFVANSYIAVLALMPPAYFWMAIRAQKEPFKGRIVNTLLLLAGTITFVVMTIIMTNIFHVGVAYWYLFLGAAYGLMSVYSVILFMMALAIMFRLFRSFVLVK